MAKKTATIHLRVEPDIKADAEKTLSRLGISTTDAINIFLNQIILTGGLPFPVRIPIPNKETLDALKEADEIMKNAKNIESESVDDFFEEMDT